MNSTDNTLHLYLKKNTQISSFSQSTSKQCIILCILHHLMIFYGIKCLWEDMVYRKDKIYLNTQDSRKIFCENEQKSTFHLRLILRKIFFLKRATELKKE